MKNVLFFLTTTAAVMTIAGGSLAADGKGVYDKACALCHNNLSPKLSEKALWEPRFKLGIDAMTASVIKGKGAMPPKAGNPALSEADIKSAVEYLAAQVK